MPAHMFSKNELLTDEARFACCSCAVLHPCGLNPCCPGTMHGTWTVNLLRAQEDGFFRTNREFKDLVEFADEFMEHRRCDSHDKYLANTWDIHWNDGHSDLS
eukprot:6480823-Amphidinium_carterae.1